MILIASENSSGRITVLKRDNGIENVDTTGVLFWLLRIPESNSDLANRMMGGNYRVVRNEGRCMGSDGNTRRYRGNHARVSICVPRKQGFAFIDGQRKRRIRIVSYYDPPGVRRYGEGKLGA